jgi:hypothetical protein
MVTHTVAGPLALTLTRTREIIPECALTSPLIWGNDRRKCRKWFPLGLSDSCRLVYTLALSILHAFEHPVKDGFQTTADREGVHRSAPPAHLDKEPPLYALAQELLRLSPLVMKKPLAKGQ